jgi:hypothetical protein
MKILKQHATVKSIGGIVLLLLVFFASVSVIGYNSFTEALMSQYSEGAFLTAETAAQMLDADRMDEYAKSGGATQEYTDILEQLDHLCNSSGSTFFYVIQPDRSDYAHITFLFSTIDHESKYTGKESDTNKGDEQFEINDSRSLDHMYEDIADEGLQPVLNDYLYV